MRILSSPASPLPHETAGPQTLSRWRPRKGRQARAAATAAVPLTVTGGTPADKTPMVDFALSKPESTA
jgi:hypothetical protein